MKKFFYFLCIYFDSLLRYVFAYQVLRGLLFVWTWASGAGRAGGFLGGGRP
jgi:hypothetical protein